MRPNEELRRLREGGYTDYDAKIAMDYVLEIEAELSRLMDELDSLLDQDKGVAPTEGE